MNTINGGAKQNPRHRNLEWTESCPGKGAWDWLKEGKGWKWAKGENWHNCNSIDNKVF